MSYYLKAVEMATKMCCPECESEGTLEYADDEVLVCRSCDYSIEAEDLQPVWQEKLEEEGGFYDAPDDLDDED